MNEPNRPSRSREFEVIFNDGQDPTLVAAKIKREAEYNRNLALVYLVLGSMLLGALLGSRFLH